MTDEVDRLRRANAELHDQLRVLLRTEQRLFQAQNDLEQRLRRIRQLNDFALASSTTWSRRAIVEHAMDAVLQLFTTYGAIVVLDGTAIARVIEGNSRAIEIPHDVQPILAYPVSKSYRLPMETAHPIVRWLSELTDEVEGNLHTFAGYRRSDVVMPLGPHVTLMFRSTRVSHVDSIVEDSDLPFLDIVAKHVMSRMEMARLHASVEQRVAERTRALEALGRLAAGIAHEINNPLTYILHNHEFLVDVIHELSAGPPANPEEMLADVREAGQHTLDGVARIRDIVANLQTYGRAETHERHTVDVNRVVQSTIESAGDELRAIGPQVMLGALPAVTCAPHRLEEALGAIVDNAVDALRTHQGVRAIQIATRGDDSRAIIEVRDSGPGMPPDVLHRIYDPFFTTKGHGGKGLGLSICRNIVEELGGIIDVETSVGRGTLVRVTLPAASNELKTLRLSA